MVISLLLCCSYLGEKLEPLIIGKYRNPRCLKQFNPDVFNVMYSSSKNSWMTTEIFKSWVFKLNTRMLSENRKILMLLDNASSHRLSDYSNIEFLYLPKNTTSLVQPLDMGIIKALKTNYSNLLIEFVCICENRSNFLEAIKSFNLRNVMQLISEAWANVTSNQIQNCWKKIFECRWEETININSKIYTDMTEMVNEVFVEELLESEINFYNGPESTDIIDPLTLINNMEENICKLSPELLNDFYALRKK
ncbi:tigger transposable element-derived protein 6-like [Octopus sinensis]|uniref:Tigger transposable element-derived protein 6-like n=1 Tax=Octopus sinensis TaxID=2607531 RepID=A0A6P7U8F4_9MOLL|nr:tigger transposable element-derived protein 6-like [Octopus sinensis]